MGNNLWTYLLGVIFLALIGTWVICCPLTGNLSSNLSIPLLWTFLTTKFNLSEFLREFFIIVGALGSFLVAITALSTAKTAEKQVTEMEEQKKLQHNPELVLTSKELVLNVFGGFYEEIFYEFLKNNLKNEDSEEVIKKLEVLKENELVNLFYWDNPKSETFEKYIVELIKMLHKSFNFKGSRILCNSNRIDNIDYKVLVNFSDKSFENAFVNLYNIGNSTAKNIILKWKFDFKSFLEVLSKVDPNIDLKYNKIDSNTEIINLNSWSTGLVLRLILTYKKLIEIKHDLLLPIITKDKKIVNLPINFLEIYSKIPVKCSNNIINIRNVAIPLSIDYQDFTGKRMDQKNYNLMLKLISADQDTLKINDNELIYHKYIFEVNIEDVKNSEK
ncbi:hypothetical protein [Methanococcus maripaludis]|uniref:Uncharacterized protein n=1 Tax=Methanococcus maripaludis TaxID=39152 RepID=A0A7J9SDH5_METMI|nr:hypothetical protein [Methanococcus maripaludis]MBB6497322.1 hypothetical protein [Methanococcus maripaludis]